MVNVAQTAQTSLESTLRRGGWAVLLRGVIAIIFGIIALRSPVITAGALIIVFAIYAFADGVLDFVFAAQLGRAGLRWGWYAFEGIASIALGVVALVYPGVTMLAVVLLVGLYAIIHGILGLIAAFSGDGLDTESRWALGLTGVLGIVLGVLLLAGPRQGAFALVWAVGFFAIIYGVALFAFGARLLMAEHRGEQHWRGPARPAATAG